MRQDRISIDLDIPLEPMTLAAYIKDSRMKLWDHAFYSHFRGSEYFKKSDDFISFKGSDLVVRRVLFRYPFPYLTIYFVYFICCPCSSLIMFKSYDTSVCI